MGNEDFLGLKNWLGAKNRTENEGNMDMDMDIHLDLDLDLERREDGVFMKGGFAMGFLLCSLPRQSNLSCPDICTLS